MNGNHRGVPAHDEVLRRAVAEISRVLHVEWNGVRAPQLVTDVLVHDGRFETERSQACLDLLLEDLSDIDLRDAQVAMRIALDLLDVGEIPLVDREHHSFGDDRHAVWTAIAQALDDRACERVDDRAEAN